MDNSAIQLIALAVTILVPVLGAIWYLKSEINGLRTSLVAKVDAVNTSLEAKIDNVRAELGAKIADNRKAIDNVRADLNGVRLELAEIRGALRGPALARFGDADAATPA